MNDILSLQRLQKLHPRVKETFRQFIESAEMELNITLRITAGYRTAAEQDALYAQGRTTAGPKVTNAKAGQSYHNYGLAIDVVELVNGKPNWGFAYEKLKPIADRFGLVWGGTFKGLVDKPHFEKSLGHTTAQLANIAKDGRGYPLI